MERIGIYEAPFPMCLLVDGTGRQSSLPLVFPSTRDENGNGNGNSTRRIWRGSPLGLLDFWTFRHSTFTSLQSPSNTLYPYLPPYYLTLGNQPTLPHPPAMAPTRTNSDVDDDDSSSSSRHAVPSLEEIIFSCGICQATVSELYPVHEDHLASHAADDDDGMGIKLWIGNCVHVFCGRHVEGGGQFTHRLGGGGGGGVSLLVRSLAN